MYLDFYHSKKRRFTSRRIRISFLSPSHKAALGALVYGIEERQGFVALIGSRPGKTNLRRIWNVLTSATQNHLYFQFERLIQRLAKNTVPRIRYRGATEDVADTVNRLHQVLIDEYKQGRNVALIVDEAQHMPVETLGICACSPISKPQRRSSSSCPGGSQNLKTS
jgi:general secretion pathway protein A